MGTESQQVLESRVPCLPTTEQEIVCVHESGGSEEKSEVVTELSPSVPERSGDESEEKSEVTEQSPSVPEMCADVTFTFHKRQHLCDRGHFLVNIDDPAF
jgi:hypothetical protein